MSSTNSEMSKNNLGLTTGAKQLAYDKINSQIVVESTTERRQSQTKIDKGKVEKFQNRIESQSEYHAFVLQEIKNYCEYRL